MSVLPLLQDPSKQIRLLKPRPTEPGETLSFDILVWDLDKAPPYNAISYAWGEPNEPSEVPRFLQEEAEQVELIMRLEKYLDPEAVTQEYHDEFGAWLDDVEPRRNLAHMELYAMFGRPLRRDCIVEGDDPDPEGTTRRNRTLGNFDFTQVGCEVSRQQSELQTIRNVVREAQASNRQMVSIAGVDRPVRRNCAYVLAQATRRSPSSCLWIDTLCIDQANPAEKSSQVAMMFKIYQQAQYVLAGIGPAADHSNTICAIMECFHAIRQSFLACAKSWQVPIDWSPIWKAILHNLGDMEIARIVATFRALSLRPYWSRLWIVQEIFAATKGNDRVYCMCGAATASRSAIDWTWKLLYSSNSHQRRPEPHAGVLLSIVYVRKHYPVYWGIGIMPGRQTSMSDIVHADCSALTGITKLFETYGDLHCADQRDSVYGLLSLVDWDAMKVEPIQPDYMKSRFDLALEVRSRSRYEYFPLAAMMKSLGIDSTTMELQDLVQRQHDATILRPIQQQDSVKDQLYGYPLYAENEMESLTECVVLGAGKGGLMIPCSGDYVKIDFTSIHFQRLNEAVGGYEYPCKDLSCHERTVGVLCEAACEGDILIPGWYDEYCVLVLRPSTRVPGEYDVIGQGLLAVSLGLQSREGTSLRSSGVQPHAGFTCTGEEAECTRFAADVRLRFNVGDVFALEAQDFEYWKKPWWTSPNGGLRCQRLAICPVAQRIGSVSLQYVRCLGADRKW